MARADRYVALGLAHGRSPWFRDVARWSTSASLPVEFLQCVTVEEVRARLRTGRPLSALLVDGGVPGVDRDLIDDARAYGCAVIVVDDGRAARDWAALGAVARLPTSFDRESLLDALETHCTQIEAASAVPAGSVRDRTSPGWLGRLVCVTGPGGTGASLAAMSLAQGLALDVRFSGLVVLADFALHADQAMLHDAGDVVPGVQELVEAHRGGEPTVASVRSMTFEVADRHYDLLLGLRRPRDWVTVRPRSFDAALTTLRRAYRATIAEVTGDVEGERDCGSIDVEERNAMARIATATADVVVVVGAPGPRGVHRLVRLVDALVDHGVDAGRILPVVNRAPRSPRGRSEITRAVAELTRVPASTEWALPSPVFLPERRRVDELLHAGVRLPDTLVTPLSKAVRMMLDRLPGAEVRTDREPVRVAPGSLGSWHDDGAGP